MESALFTFGTENASTSTRRRADALFPTLTKCAGLVTSGSSSSRCRTWSVRSSLLDAGTQSASRSHCGLSVASEAVSRIEGLSTPATLNRLPLGVTA